MYKKNNKRAYSIVAIIGIAIFTIFLINQNYNISVNNQNLDDVIPVDSFEKTMDGITDTVGNVAESIPVKIEPKSTPQTTPIKQKMSQTEMDALRADWMKNRFSDKYRNIEMDCPNHPLKPGYLVFDPNKIDDAIFERCILPSANP